MRRIITVTLAAAAISLLGGCKTTAPNTACACSPCTCAAPCTCGSSTASMGMVNDSCPMSGKKLGAGCSKSTWNGKTVGFCGNGCKAKFDGSDDAGKKTFVAQCQGN